VAGFTVASIAITIIAIATTLITPGVVVAIVMGTAFITTFVASDATISVVSRDPNFAHASLVMAGHIVAGGMAVVAIADDPTAFDPNIIRNITPVTVAISDANRRVVVTVAIKCIRNDETTDDATENREPFVSRIGGSGGNDHNSGGEK